MKEQFKDFQGLEKDSSNSRAFKGFQDVYELWDLDFGQYIGNKMIC